MTTDELMGLIEQEIAETQARIDDYDERYALRHEASSNETTTKRALEALERAERFPGEHAVASAWLTHHAERIWTRT